MTVPRLRLTLVAACIGMASASAWPRLAAATMVLRMPFESQSTTADRVFVGTVAARESRENAAAPGYFETIVTFDVEEVVAGTVPDSIALRFSGGQVGNVVQSIAGMPQCQRGERYVVFLEPERERDPPLMSPVVGFNQGLYLVVDDPAGGAGSLVRDRSGRPLTAGGSGSAAAAVPGTAVANGEPSLGGFVAAIKAARAE